jgi:MFS family permease
MLLRPDAPTDAASARVGARSWLALAVLFAAYVCAFVDRQALNLLVEPIKRDFRLSDVQVSLLQGFAFALVLSVGAFPMGRLIDTRRRTAILASSVAVWSLTTAGCGLARSFGQLLALRVGVGVGEAAMTPCAYSLIGDFFPPRRLGLAVGLFSTGSYLGSGLALLFGAAAIAHAPTGLLRLPVVGLLHGWQLVFLVVGAPGLLVALAVGLLGEPVRRVGGQAAAPTLAQARGYFASAWPAIAPCNLAVAFAVMAVYALFAWSPSLMIRHFGLAPHQVGLLLGPVVMACGAGGTFAAGLAGDALRTRFADGRLRIMLGAGLATIPLTLLIPQAASPCQFVALLAPILFLLTLAVGSGPATLQEITPNRLLGLQHALAVFVTNLLGMGVGPTVIALITDRLLHDERQLPAALGWGLPAMLTLSALCAALALRPYRRSALAGAPGW